MCEFSLTPFLSLFSAFLPLSFTLRVWAFCCIYFSIPWSNDKDGGGEILWSSEQLLLEKPLSAFFSILLVFHTRICSLCWRVFFLFLWKLQSSWFHQKESAPAFHFPSFIHLFPAAVSIPYIYSPIPHLGRTGVVENIPQHDFNSAVYLWGWRGGYQIVHLTKPCQNLLFLSLATTFWNLCPRWYSSFLVWLLPVKVLLFCF